ncbi:hypothetical protein OHB25_07775 [Streptomyces mirabilis]|uniref:hypothetical protein n=1 Tax=Streptomyces TaxID=1883 RepID=UPI001F07A636|nr:MULTISPECIES: hypothetical protein [Streptomyces]MCX4615061.1 hypothetical protein [Streptomyces mirabilis]
MKNVIMRRQLHVLATVAALTLGVADAGSAQAGPAARGRPTAEIFATDNTAIITDPADSRLNTRLTLFDQEVRKIIHAHGARSGSSTLLDGVFWSGDLRKATYERSEAVSHPLSAGHGVTASGGGRVARVPAGRTRLLEWIRVTKREEVFRCLSSRRRGWPIAGVVGTEVTAMCIRCPQTAAS